MPAGQITKEWAEKLGLNQEIAVTVGAFDPHMGAVGAQIPEGIFVKVIRYIMLRYGCRPKKR